LVIAQVHLVVPLLPLLAGIFALHGFFCGSEGLLLGQTDLSFLGKVYGVRSVLCGCALFRAQGQGFAVEWCGEHWDDESVGGLSLLSGEECAGTGTGDRRRVFMEWMLRVCPLVVIVAVLVQYCLPNRIELN
jgi:hypothetical protein